MQLDWKLDWKIGWISREKSLFIKLKTISTINFAIPNFYSTSYSTHHRMAHPLPETSIRRNDKKGISLRSTARRVAGSMQVVIPSRQTQTPPRNPQLIVGHIIAISWVLLLTTSKASKSGKLPHKTVNTINSAGNIGNRLPFPEGIIPDFFVRPLLHFLGWKRSLHGPAAMMFIEPGKEWSNALPRKVVRWLSRYPLVEDAPRDGHSGHSWIIANALISTHSKPNTHDN